MKLRNKTTEEIGYLISTNWNETALVIMDKDGVQLAKYTSLTELNEEWEDYEEPKKYWFINPCGEVVSFYEEDENPDDTKASKAIGDYFDTREEAEQAVEKLKAWKRLKDNGFKFDEWERDKEFSGDYIIKASDYHTCDDKDLELLFGGK